MLSIIPRRYHRQLGRLAGRWDRIRARCNVQYIRGRLAGRLGW